jgi:hypothetical protein
MYVRINSGCLEMTRAGVPDCERGYDSGEKFSEKHVIFSMFGVAAWLSGRFMDSRTE